MPNFPLFYLYTEQWSGLIDSPDGLWRTINGQGSFCSRAEAVSRVLDAPSDGFLPKIARFGRDSQYNCNPTLREWLTRRGVDLSEFAAAAINQIKLAFSSRRLLLSDNERLRQTQRT